MKKCILIAVAVLTLIQSVPVYAMDALPSELINQLPDNINLDDASEVINWVQDKLDSGELDPQDENSIREVIEEGEETFGVELDSSQKDAIVKVTENVDPQVLLDNAENLFDKYGVDAVQHADEIIKETAGSIFKKAIKDFFSDMWTAIKEAFSSAFK